MGREYRSKLEEIQILWKAKLPAPLDWSNVYGPPPDYTTQDEGYEQTEYYEDYPQEAYDQEEQQEYEREYRDSDSRALVVASPPRTVESRELNYGPMVSSLLPDLYLLDPSQFQQPVQYMVPQFNFPLPEGFSYLPVPTGPPNPILAIGSPLIEENSLSLVPLAPKDPHYPSDRDEEGPWGGI